MGEQPRNTPYKAGNYSTSGCMHLNWVSRRYPPVPPFPSGALRQNGAKEERFPVAPLSSMKSKEQAMVPAPIGFGESTAVSRKLVGLGVEKKKKTQ